MESSVRGLITFSSGLSVQAHLVKLLKFESLCWHLFYKWDWTEQSVKVPKSGVPVIITQKTRSERLWGQILKIELNEFHSRKVCVNGSSFVRTMPSTTPSLLGSWLCLCPAISLVAWLMMSISAQSLSLMSSEALHKWLNTWGENCSMWTY